MSIKDLYNERITVFSMEIFPPKPITPVESIYHTLAELHTLKPDFISVTYGAGGSNRGRTVEIAKHIRETYQIDSMAHLTCVGHTKEEIQSILNEINDAGVENILALRGDLPLGVNLEQLPKGGFEYAKDLVKYIKQQTNFSLGAAAYPEGHPESPDKHSDTVRLKEKVEAGVDFLVTQLFLDNKLFYDFMERIRRAGITVPVSAGIMPILNSNIQRIISLSKATVPNELTVIIEKYRDKPVDMEKAGMDFAIQQIEDLIHNGVDGIHLYTMNRARQSRFIFDQVRAHA
jgi:methylenetetrahydrofolate reductase (NADPH)